MWSYYDWVVVVVVRQLTQYVVMLCFGFTRDIKILISLAVYIYIRDRVEKNWMFVFIICFYTPTLNKICICICINFRQEVLIIRTFQRRFHVKCRDLYTIMEI